MNRAAAIGEYEENVEGLWSQGQKNELLLSGHLFLARRLNSRQVAARDQKGHTLIVFGRRSSYLHRSLMQTDRLFDPLGESPAILDFRRWLVANGASVHEYVRFKTGKCF